MKICNKLLLILYRKPCLKRKLICFGNSLREVERCLNKKC